MIAVKDITDLNIQDIISQLTSEVINGDTTSSSAKFACEINSYIINYKLLNINLINTQLKIQRYFIEKAWYLSLITKNIKDIA